MALKVGDKAVAVKLSPEPKQWIDLGDEIGKNKIVLLFFPLAFSGVCTKELCTMRDNWSKWSGLNAKIYGVSVDSPFVNKKFAEENKLPFALLSDFNREAAKAYGVLMEDLIGLKNVAMRSAFVIDRNGKVAYSWVAENPGIEPNYDEVQKAVQTAA
ncbi:MAG: redoxin domain-containing protein [Phycisphaerales bacterium]|nr:redoxin domain-containing protein [Phycisphaerales bacterium]